MKESLGELEAQGNSMHSFPPGKEAMIHTGWLKGKGTCVWEFMWTVNSAKLSLLTAGCWHVPVQWSSQKSGDKTHFTCDVNSQRTWFFITHMTRYSTGRVSVTMFTTDWCLWSGKFALMSFYPALVEHCMHSTQRNFSHLSSYSERVCRTPASTFSATFYVTLADT